MAKNISQIAYNYIRRLSQLKLIIFNDCMFGGGVIGHCVNELFGDSNNGIGESDCDFDSFNSFDSLDCESSFDRFEIIFLLLFLLIVCVEINDNRIN